MALYKIKSRNYDIISRHTLDYCPRRCIYQLRLTEQWTPYKLSKLFPTMNSYLSLNIY